MTTTHSPTVPAVEPIGHREAMVLARTAYARFADVVEQLGAEDWDRPTDCEGWTVRDLVGHVVGAMRSAASVRELASQQLEVRRRVRDTGVNPTDAMTQIQIDRTADLDTAALVAECRAMVDRATAGRRRTPAPFRRFASAKVEAGSVAERWTIGYLVDVILTRDAWLHRVDLCRAIHAEPVVTADHDGRIIADVVGEWARRHGQAFHLTLTGPAGGTFSSGSVDEGEQLVLDAVDFCRIVSRRAPCDGLLATEVPF
jgi:uncharacterized protein (TIGR03083 family)